MWLRILKGVLLGLVQGLTEFLPVSSSGHLLLLERMGVAAPSLFLNLTLHLSTLLAVCIVMRREVWDWVRHPISKQARWLYLSCLPTAAIAVLLTRFAEDWIDGRYLAVGFLATSCLLLLSGRLPNRNKPLAVPNALWVGVVHGLAVLPGVSRSGATVSAMRYAGIDPQKGVTLSFLLAIPVTVGGMVWQLVSDGVADIDVPLCVAACVAAFLSGLVSLRLMLRAFGQSMPLFAVYTLALSVVSLFV